MKASTFPNLYIICIIILSMREIHERDSVVTVYYESIIIV